MTSAHAIAIRDVRRARVLAIRRRVVAAALALFVATWLLITLILVTGHDPALARSTKATAAQTTITSTAPASTGTTSSSTATSSSSTGATSSNTGSSSGSGTSSVTSSQS